jgi:hypothetical protein
MFKIRREVKVQSGMWTFNFKFLERAALVVNGMHVGLAFFVLE